MPKLSIIIPVYNAERTLSHCVESVLSQRFSDFELLLINDGSTDLSLSICNEFAKQDKRVKVIEQENGGVSSARNKGLLQACGDWVTFIDSDDKICEEYFSIFDYNPIEDLIVGSIYIETCKVLCTLEGPPIGVSGLTSYSFTESQLTNTLFNGPCAKFYKRSIIVENNIYFDEDLYFGEDAVFVKTYLLYINSYCSSNKIIYNYNDIGEAIYKKYNKSFASILNYYGQINNLYKRLEYRYNVRLSRNDVICMVYNLAIENISSYGLRDWEYLHVFLSDSYVASVLHKRESIHISNIMKLARLDNKYLFIIYFRVIEIIKKMCCKLFWR